MSPSLSQALNTALNCAFRAHLIDGWGTLSKLYQIDQIRGLTAEEAAKHLAALVGQARPDELGPQPIARWLALLNAMEDLANHTRWWEGT